MKSIRLFLSVFAFFFCTFLRGQASDCSAISIDNASGAVGETICLPVRVAGFEEITVAQFSMRWNPAILAFQSVQISAFPTALNENFGMTNANDGTLLFAWNDPSFNGQTLADEDTLFSVCFKIIGNLGSFSAVSIGNVPITVGFENKDLERVTPNLAQSTVTVSNNAPNFDPILMKGCVKNMACAGSNGEISISTTGGQPPYSFSWSGPSGFLSSLEDLQNLQPGNYYLTVLDAVGQVKKASFQIENTGFAPFSLKITPKNVTCPIKNDGAINLEILSTNPPSITFLWSNGATTQNLDSLVAGNYSVIATDTGGCDVILQTKIEETAGFSAFLTVDNPNCLVGQSLGSIDLDNLPTTASAPFSFLWSNGSSDSTILNAPPGEYLVTVTDFGGCSEVFSATISDDLLVDWQVSIATDCIPNTTLGNITAYLVAAPFALAPFTFSWSNNVVETIDSIASQPIKSDLNAAETGFYTLNISDAHGCDFFIEDILVDCKKPANTTESCFTIRGNAVAAPDASKICVPFLVENMDSIIALQFGMTWDTTRLQFSSVITDSTTIIGQSNYSFKPQTPDLLRFVWVDFFPITPINGTKLTEVCFLPIGAAGTETEISIISIKTSGTSPLILGVGGGYFTTISLPFQAQNARVTFAPTPPTDLKLEFCTILPDCANDAKADINLEVSGGTPPYIFNWTGDNGFAATTKDISKIAPAEYNILVTDFVGKKTTGIVSIMQTIDTLSDCVWPGDADDNATVNHFDLLTLGLGLGQNGPPRTSAGTLWTGYNSANWAQETPVSKVNFQHLDMDGVGTILPTDLTVLEQNWGETIFPIATDPNLQPPDFQSFIVGNNPAIILIPTDTLEAGTAATIPILVGLPTAPVVDLYGIAFSIYYDTTKFKASSVYFQPTNSWLGQAGDNLLFVQKNFPEKGRIDIALTRTDGQNLTGFGEIGLAYVIIEEDIYLREDDPFRGPIDTVILAEFDIRHIRGISYEEKLIELEGKFPPFYLCSKTISTSELTDLAQKINVFPNPVSDEITIQSAVFIQKMRIFGADGSAFDQKIIDSNTVHFSMKSMPIGIYFLQIFTEKGIAMKKVWVK